MIISRFTSIPNKNINHLFDGGAGANFRLLCRTFAGRDHRNCSGPGKMGHSGLECSCHFQEIGRVKVQRNGQTLCQWWDILVHKWQSWHIGVSGDLAIVWEWKASMLRAMFDEFLAINEGDMVLAVKGLLMITGICWGSDPLSVVQSTWTNLAD